MIVCGIFLYVNKELNTNNLYYENYNKELIQEKIDKALYCFKNYYLQGLEVIDLIEKQEYERIEDILKIRDKLFHNFKTMEFILKDKGIDLFKEKIEGIDVEILVSKISDINTKIQNNKSKILSYYRNNLLKLSCSLNYIKKAKHTRKESNFRKEV